MSTGQVATERLPARSQVDLEDMLRRLRAGFEREPYPSLEARLENLRHLERSVLRAKHDFAAAISRDFGNRSKHESLLEVFGVVENVRYARAHLAKWMKSQKRSMNAALLPASTRVHYQPKGVIGIISPWNYPLFLSLGPMVGALAAGNRVMLKPSELTPETSDMLRAVIGETFPPDLARVATGGVEVGVVFSKLRFDHLLFTGSTHVGKQVMKAAAEHLVPVTLELGGKSPTIVHESFPSARAAEAIAMGKWLNAGQTCIAPDYLLVQEGKVDELVRAIGEKVRAFYPSGLRDNADYTSIVSARHRDRIASYLADARSKGARVIEINPRGESFEGTNKLPPTLLLDVNDEMIVMQEEIFGPVLPIVTYRRLEDAMRYVNDRPRPLALYYFDDDRSRIEKVLEGTISGGAGVNVCVLHALLDDAPFGGIGPSGMGAYHGVEGFQTFSHAKTVLYQAKLNASALLAPPYGRVIDTTLRFLMGG